MGLPEEYMGDFPKIEALLRRQGLYHNEARQEYLGKKSTARNCLENGQSVMILRNMGDSRCRKMWQ